MGVGMKKVEGKLESPVVHQVFILVTWDYEYTEDGQVKEATPLVRTYPDRSQAVGIYKDAVTIRDAAYLYVTDEMGNWNIILELD
jgi:hypothetical protein